MKRILSAITLSALFLLALSSAEAADIAPPQHPPGVNPEPGNEITQVRMLAETVVLDVPLADPPIAHVRADFTMHNLGNSTENMVVSFPLSSDDGSCHMNEIKNVKIKANGRSTTYRRVESPATICGSENAISVSVEFDVSFPAGEDVGITVSYDLDGTSYEYETYTNFYYILATGAGWKGTIGSGEIILRMPYEASPLNVILDDPMNTALGTTRGIPEFAEHEARWSFTDLEPTTSDNLTFDIVKPIIWNQVVIGLENVAQNPQDGEAWGFLGKAYKQALFASGKGYPRVDAAAAELYQLSKNAYEKAVTLDPKDGLWHAGYAELLLDEYYWVSYQDRSYTVELDRGLKELNLAVQLAPEAAKVKDLIEEYVYMFPDYILKQTDGSLEFISLTRTPTPVIATDTPIPTRTFTATPPPATVTPQTKDTSRPGSPLCGGAALILLPLALVVWKTRLKI